MFVKHCQEKFMTDSKKDKVWQVGIVVVGIRRYKQEETKKRGK